MEVKFSQERIFWGNISEDILATDLEEDFFNEFKRRSYSQYMTSTTNFTAGLHLSMCAIDLKRGDKVLCAVNSNPAIPEVVRHFDAEPIFVDTEDGSSQIDLQKLRTAIKKSEEKKLKAIVVSHIGGEMADLQKVKQIIGKRQIYLIEDGTGTIGLDRSQIDNIADVKVFSFDNSVSEMGVFATDTAKIFEKAELLMNHGIVYNSEIEIKDYIYDVIDTGCQYRASQIDLFMAIHQLKYIDNDLEIRRNIAKEYFKGLDGLRKISIQKPDLSHSYKNMIIRVDKNRDGFAEELYKRGIETRLLNTPLHLFSYYKNKYELGISAFPNALLDYQQILFIPMHIFLKEEEIDYIIDSITELTTKMV
jgi:perosamine synthetase